MIRFLPMVSFFVIALISVPAAAQKSPDEVFRRLDADGNGRVSRDEWPKPMPLFDRIDADGDGVLVYEEVRDFFGGRRQSGNRQKRDAGRFSGSTCTFTPSQVACEGLTLKAQSTPPST
jgi:hypothetical protein